MRSLGVCAILLALAVVAPPSALRSPYEPLWALGGLVLLGLTAQNAVSRVRLPAVAGWLLAGLALGPTALATIELTRVPLLGLAGLLAGVWSGLVTGLAVHWPVEQRTWRLPAVVAASTAVTLCAAAGGIALFVGVPLPVALVFGGVAATWGPAVANFWHSQEVGLISLVGSAASLVLVSAVLAGGSGLGLLPAGGLDWVARLWLAAGLGALAAEGLSRTGWLQHRTSALSALGAVSFAGALVASHFSLPSLPLGLGAGLVLAVRQGAGRHLARLLAPAQPLAILLFAALLVCSADAASLLWPPAPGLYEIVLLQAVVLVAVRGFGPRLWYPRSAGIDGSRRSSWLLLPKGLLSGELVLAWGGAGLPALLAAPYGDLLRRVALADLFVYALLFATVAALQSPGAAAEPQSTAIPA